MPAGNSAIAATADREIPHGATQAEREAFDAGHNRMQQGFGAAYDQLDQYLASAAQEERK